MPQSIFLIGLPGSGKSTVGRLVARETGRNFIDSDREIELRSGVSIATIFELEGEAGFRKRESQVLDELTQRADVVLATGGGAVLAEANRTHLRSRGLVIYLEVSTDELVRRTSGDTSRPLLQADDPRTRVVELMQLRQPLYEATSHVSFHSGAANPRRLVKRIIEHPLVRSALRG
ncbi:MAG: shikimate kinase [Betaproteobacteria bacterium]|jgi:shikimate kinase